MMKKIGFLIFSLIMVISVTGCGKNDTKVLTCTGDSKGNNMNASSEAKYIFENEKLTEAEVEVVFKDITVPNLSSVWDTYKNQFNEQNLPVEAEGFKRTTKADDDKYTFTVTMEIDYEKISKETMETYGLEDITKKTYDEIKKEMISESKYTCK